MSKKRLGPKNLKEAVSRMGFCHNVRIEHIFTNVNKRQRELFDKNSSTVGLGLFYEVVTKGLFGGKLHERSVIEVGKERLSTVVDVLDGKRKRAWEVKGRYFGKSFPLTDDQMDKYKGLQKFWETYKIYFALYTHEVSSLRSYERDESQFFKELANKTLCSVIFPLSLAIQFHESFDNSLVSRQDIDEFHDKQYTERDEHMTKILASTMGRLFYKPKSVIEQLELNPGDYKVERFCSPKNFFVEGNKVKKFPILMISHKNYASWRDKFLLEDS